MLKGLSVMLLVGLSVSLLIPGCGGTGSLQPGEGGNGSDVQRAAYIPPPGTVLTQRTVDWASLFPGFSRAVDTPLALGKLSDSAGEPVADTVNQNRINLFSAQIPSAANPIVWTVTPTPNNFNQVGDNDLGIYADGYGVFASSTNVGTWEEWAAFDPYYTVGQHFGLVFGSPDGISTHAFRVEADRSSPLTVNGSAKTGEENVTGSDWFHFSPIYNYDTGSYDPITVKLTALSGTDPDVYLYDSYYGNGSAPVVQLVGPAGGTVRYTTPSGYRLFARVYAAGATTPPCKYKISVISP